MNRAERELLLKGYAVAYKRYIKGECDVKEILHIKEILGKVFKKKELIKIENEVTLCGQKYLIDEWEELCKRYLGRILVICKGNVKLIRSENEKNLNGLYEIEKFIKHLEDVGIEKNII